MSAHRSDRRVFLAALVAIAGLLQVAAAPASAVPVIDGRIGAYGFYVELNGADGCTYSPTKGSDGRKSFTSATGRRTTRIATDFRATPYDGPVVSAHGRVETATSGVADATNGAFDRVKLTANHFVRLTDDTRSDCGMRLVSESLGFAEFDATRRGRVRIAWDRGTPGIFGWVEVRNNGNRVYSRVRSKAHHGEATFRLRRGGHYTVSVLFWLRVSERDVPVGETLTKRTHFRVVVDYLG